MAESIDSASSCVASCICDDEVKNLCELKTEYDEFDKKNGKLLFIFNIFIYYLFNILVWLDLCSCA